MRNDQTGLIPKNLDNLPRIFLWDIYQGLFFFMLMGVGIVFGKMLLGMAAGGLAAWVYGRLSSGMSRGFLVHLIYWFAPPSATKYKFLPPSFKRKFRG